jgi:hypothetical protein
MAVEQFNNAVRDGSVGSKLGRILEEMRPEAAYFVEDQGRRTGYFVVNVDQPSQIPSLAEPFYLWFNAEVEFKICMKPEDLQQAGLDQIGKRYK